MIASPMDNHPAILVATLYAVEMEQISMVHNTGSPGIETNKMARGVHWNKTLNTATILILVGWSSLHQVASVSSGSAGSKRRDVAITQVMFSWWLEPNGPESVF